MYKPWALDAASTALCVMVCMLTACCSCDSGPAPAGRPDRDVDVYRRAFRHGGLAAARAVEELGGEGREVHSLLRTLLSSRDSIVIDRAIDACQLQGSVAEPLVPDLLGKLGMDEFMLRDLHVAVALADICPFAALECLARMAARLRQGEGGMYEAELWCQVAFLRAELGASDGVLSDLVFLAQADSLSRVESVMDVVATLEGIDLADAVSLAAKRPADMRVLAAYLAGEFAGEAEDAQVLLRNLCRDESSKVRHAARISLRLTENSVK